MSSASDTRVESGDGQALAERVVATMLDGDAFSRWLGCEVTALAPHACTVRMRVRPEMVNGFGVCHGGIAFSLADSALAFAANTHGSVTVSIENSITYPAPVHVGDELEAVAAAESVGGRVSFYRVVVTKQDGSAVGLFRGTVYDTRRDFFAARPSGEGRA